MMTTMQHEEEQQQQQPLMLLPLGYKFRPTDRELLFYFLKNKLKDPTAFQPAAVPIYDIQLYDHHPKIILDNFGVQGHNNNPECYVFTMRHRKFLHGDKANRILKDNIGYWRASYSNRGDQFHERRRCGGLVGERMNLVYYDTTTTTSTTSSTNFTPDKKQGTKKGTKTEWLMNEYKIKPPAADNDNDGAEKDLVLCKIYLNNRQKNKGISNHQQQQYNMQQEQPYLQQQQYIQQEQPYWQQQQEQYMQQELQPPEQYMQQEQPYLQQPQPQPQQEQYMQQELQPPEQYMQQEQPYLQQPQPQPQQEQYMQQEQPDLLQQQQQQPAAVDNQAASNTGTTYRIDEEIDANTFWDQLMSQAPEPQQTGMGMISIDDYAY